MKISVIIPTLNEEAFLPKLLESLKIQTFRDFEVVVADAKSTDKTRSIAKRFGAKVVDGGMPGPGRNAGAKAAKGDLFVFLDADVKLPDDFLENVHEEMDYGFYDIATCEMRPISNLLIDKVMHRAGNLAIKVSQNTNRPYAPGFCIIITKRLFERIGGFDPSLKLAEDHDLVTRACKHRPMHFLKRPFFWVSVRRMSKEGRLSYIQKILQVEMHRAIQGKIKKDSKIEYEFASFNKKKLSKLRTIENQIMKLERQYNRLKKISKDELQMKGISEKYIEKLKGYFLAMLKK
jgi:glycosyltransferase involved in cell wall biosynthesis